jgi:hypothetical protein
MFVFAIETCGRTVALIQEDNRLMLDGFLNGEREEGRILRRDIVQPIYWDGTSPFTARLATASEELDYSLMYYESHGEMHGKSLGESEWYFYGDFAAYYCSAKRHQLENKAA